MIFFYKARMAAFVVKIATFAKPQTVSGNGRKPVPKKKHD